MPIYEIELYGYGLHAGMDKISKQSYEFWKDRDDVAEATDPNLDFDFEAIGVSPKSDLSLWDFWDYNSVVSFSGLDLGQVEILVFDENRNTVYKNYIDDLFAERSKDEEYYETTDRLDDFYIRAYDPSSSDLVKGHYLCWNRTGKGLWFTGKIEAPEGKCFDIEKVQFASVDFEGYEYLTSVIYEDQELRNEGYEIRWNDPDISFFESTNENLRTETWQYELY